MHVRASAGNFAQTRRLECVPHFDHARKEFAAADIVVRKASVVEAVVSKIPSAVTVRAACFGVEQRKSALCLFRDRFLIAFDPRVEGSAPANHRALVGRNRSGDALGCEPLLWEGGSKQGYISWDAPKLLDQLINRQVHFYVCPDRTECLLLKRRRPAVPHEYLTERRIHDGWRPTTELLHAMPDAFRLTIPPPISRAVTGGAGQKISCRQARIEVQFLAEVDLFDRIWVVLGKRN